MKRKPTYDKLAEKEIGELRETLAKRVESRTRDMETINNELKTKTENLEDVNTTLKVILERRGEDRAEIEEKIIANVNELIMPIIDTLKNTRLDDRQSAWVDILEANLKDIMSPFSRELSSKYWRLTPVELQVANFIRSGKTTKEIALALGVAPSTISTYRNNIRRKLEIKNRKINLKAYLADLE